MNFLQRIGRWLRGMVTYTDIEDAFGVTIATSSEMLQHQEDCRNAFFGTMSWNNDKVISRRTAAQIAGEYGRVVTIEHESDISGSPRAEWLNEQYKPFVEQKQLQTTVSKLVAGGEIVLRFSVNAESGISIYVVENNEYFPVRYNANGELLEFYMKVDTQYKNDSYYTLIEHNDYDEPNRIFTKEYYAFKSGTEDVLGSITSVKNVPDWANLRDTYENQAYRFGNQSKWFVHIKTPMQNDVEQSSQNGVSIYSKALDNFRKLDELGEWIDHEFKAGRLRQNASKNLFRKDRHGNPVMDDDLFQAFDIKSLNEKQFIETYNPDPRIAASNEREQRLLREIEFLCQMSYGILSDPRQQAKTATEIEASRERFGSAIKSIQGTMEVSQREAVQIMDEITTFYQLAPQGNYDMSFFWDDSVIESQKEKDDRFNAELGRLMLLLQAQLIKPEVVTAFFYENSNYLSKITDEQITAALELMPGAFEESETGTE